MDVNPYDTCKEIMRQIEDGTAVSCLGGVPEGIVLKHPLVIHRDESVTSTKLKFVSKGFKEQHKRPNHRLGDLVNKFKSMNKTSAVTYTDDFVKHLGLSCNTEARFQKAYQHLVEAECVDMVPTVNDIGKFETELDEDFDKEYREEMMLELYLMANDVILKLARAGSFDWFMTKIGQPVPLTEQVEEKVDIDDGVAYKLIVGLGHKYAQLNDFQKVYDMSVGKTVGVKSDYGRFLKKYNEMFELEHKADVQQVLWNVLGPVIRSYARQDFMCWFQQKFNV